MSVVSRLSPSSNFSDRGDFRVNLGLRSSIERHLLLTVTNGADLLHHNPLHFVVVGDSRKVCKRVHVHDISQKLRLLHPPFDWNVFDDRDLPWTWDFWRRELWHLHRFGASSFGVKIVSTLRTELERTGSVPRTHGLPNLVFRFLRQPMSTRSTQTGTSFQTLSNPFKHMRSL